MNKNAFVYVFVVILIIIAGTYVWHSSKTKEHISNGEMLKSAKNTPITTIENLEYFPGAKGYFAEPKEKGNYPGIVVIHENRGLRPETKFTVEQLAKEGYMVLAVDLLGKTVETQEEARALAQTFSQATGTKNMQAAFDYLQKRGATKVASLGWCFGGAQSLQLALSGTKLDATVIYYGRLATTTKTLSPITWPVLGIFGDKDTVISTSSVDQFKKALAELGIKHEIYMYEGVGHAFANPSGMNYAPDQTKDAWQKTLLFLENSLKKAPLSQEQTSTQKPLVGTKWAWKETLLLDGQKTVAPSGNKFVLSLDKERRASSSTDCNRMSGTYIVDGEVLSFGPMIMTKMFCEGSMEMTYAEQLSLTNSYQINGDELRINLNRDYGTMIFSALEE